MRWTVCIAAILAGCGVVKAPSTSDAAPIKAITTILTAQVQYHSIYGRFAASLAELGPPSNGPDGPSAAGLIERDLASGDKGGYKFTLSAAPAGFLISAVGAGRSYYSDQTIAIHVHNGPEPATADDPVLGETATIYKRN